MGRKSIVIEGKNSSTSATGHEDIQVADRSHFADQMHTRSARFGPVLAQQFAMISATSALIRM